MALFALFLKEQMHGNGHGSSGYGAEANYYCEDNNYDYSKAKKAYEEDMKFERDHNLVKKKKGCLIF